MPVLEAGRTNLSDDSIVRVPSVILLLTPSLTMSVAMSGAFGKNFFQPL